MNLFFKKIPASRSHFTTSRKTE